jgi:hypothetical protein
MSAYTIPAFWERLWRTAGIQSVGLCILPYLVWPSAPDGRVDRRTRRVLGGGRTGILMGWCSPAWPSST